MDFVLTYIACAGGVILSIIVPILAKAVKQQFTTGGPAHHGGLEVFIRAAWQWTRPYVILGAFSFAVALLIVAFSGDLLRTWQAALIAGYLWDSTLQKITGVP